MSTAAEIFQAVEGRIPNRNDIYISINTAIRLIAKRLRLIEHSLVMKNFSVSVVSGDTSATMPNDFWGLVTAPYILEYRQELDPLPDQRYRIDYGQTNGIPVYFELENTTLDLIPTSSASLTIQGKYFFRPTKITKPSDEIPWNELFDETIEEALIYSNTKQKTGNELQLMREYITTQVDEFAPHYDMAAPGRIIDDEHLDELSNNGDYW